MMVAIAEAFFEQYLASVEKNLETQWTPDVLLHFDCDNKAKEGHIFGAKESCSTKRRYSLVFICLDDA